MVWSAAERDGFVEDTQAMRRRVIEHIPAKEAERQLKLGEGGLRDVDQGHFVAGQHGNMGNAVAHLAGADHADSPDVFDTHRSSLPRPQAPLSSSFESSGRAWNRSATRP